MPPTVRAALITSVLGLIGVLATGVVTWSIAKREIDAKERERDEARRLREREEQLRRDAEARVRTYEQRVQGAPTVFVERLGETIERAREAARPALPDVPGEEAPPRDRPRLEEVAPAIVSTRNDFRRSLESIGSKLNDDIDRLATELAKGSETDWERVRTLVGILGEKWPAKREDIALAIRKMLAELGLDLK